MQAAVSARRTVRVPFAPQAVVAMVVITVLGVAAPWRSLSAQAVDGAKVYAATCLACHQASGLGLVGQFPPLVGSEWVIGREDRLVLVMLHGITGEIEVEGETYNGAMPPWGATLSNDEIAAVATYVRRRWGNNAAPVTIATVARLRTAHAARSTPWTASALQQQLPPVKPSP